MAKSTAIAKARTVETMLRDQAPKFTQALAGQVDVDRLVRVCASQIATTPRLAECSIPSLVTSIIQAGKLGLEPGLLGQCYLVPYGKVCTLIVGYRGLIDLARRSGEIAKIEAHIVHEHDVFVLQRGTDERLLHEPPVWGERGDIVGAYALAVLVDGTRQWETMTADQINAIRDSSQGYRYAEKSGKRDSAWHVHWGEMARKTVVRRLVKYLPMSVESMRAINDDDRRSFNLGTIDVTQAPREEAPVTITATELNRSPAESAEIAARQWLAGAVLELVEGDQEMADCMAAIEVLDAKAAISIRDRLGESPDSEALVAALLP